MIPDLPRSPERFGFAALVVLTLSPVLLQGVWRPLAELLHVEVGALPLAGSTLLSAAVVVFLHAVVPKVSRLVPPAAASIVAAASGLFLGSATLAGLASAASLLAVALFAATLFPCLVRRLPAELDGLAARRKITTLLMVLLGIATITATTRIAIFMGDSAYPELSIVPEMPFLVHHSCLTAYVEGAAYASQGAENVYDAAHWPDLNGTPRSDSPTGTYAPFALDAFAYPPPFLLLPQLLLSWLPNFAAQRALWFSFNGLVIAAGLWIVASWLGGRAGLRALLLAPAFWLAAPTIATLQVGNAHALVMVISVLALIAFETRRSALGGALLAFAILSKVSPGLLVLVLLVRGRFRDVAWTAGFGTMFVLAGLLVFGTAPFVAFVTYQLPRLNSGEALTFLAGPDSVPINLSPFGVPFKLAFLGMDVGDPWAVARIINRVFTVALLVLAVAGARRSRGPRASAEVWAALLTLASLQSPLAPGYICFALLWLFCIRAIDVRGPTAIVAFAVGWVILTVIPPLGANQLLLFTMGQQVVILAIAVYCVLWPSNEGISTTVSGQALA